MQLQDQFHHLELATIKFRYGHLDVIMVSASRLVHDELSSFDSSMNIYSWTISPKMRARHTQDARCRVYDELSH